MYPNDLALNGGPRAVSTEYVEGWRQVRPSDLKPILAAARNDVNTEAKGEGPIADFEQKFAQLTGSRYALAMNSGTAALHSAYFALGVKPGTEVIVPGYTFFATAAPILQCGGRPVFCDVNPETLVADPDDAERRITPRTRAICVVHLCTQSQSSLD
jgi:perosamine synthetase